VSGLVRFIFSAGGILAIAATCAVWLLLRPRSRRPARVLAAAAAGYLVVSVPALPAAMDNWLAAGFDRFEAGEVSDRRAAIVVLGSGGATVVDWAGNRFATVDVEAAARVLEAARIFRMMPAATVISSGGNSGPLDHRTPTGESMRLALLELGIPAAQVLVETESRNTRDEAVVIARIVQERQIEQVILVTSRVHMRRALGAFRAVGIDAIPAGARDPLGDLRPVEQWLPGDRGLWYSGRVAHELLGLVYYRARGWLRT
jgi:uncharacterized SAM-binding protein YcdF (DUF218 family)